MTRFKRLAAPILALAALAGCAGQGTQLSASGGVCRQVAETLLRGQRASFGLRFQAAEDAFSELLGLYDLDPDAVACPRAPSRPFILMNQALAHSSQERFVTADGLFDRAETLLDAPGMDPQESARDRALLSAYRAQDQLNRSILEGARSFVEVAAERLERSSGGAQLALSAAGAQSALGGGVENQRSLIEEASNQHTLAHIRLLEGDAAGAERAINRALDVISVAPRTAAAYRPRFLSQRSLVKLEQGDYEAARRDAASAGDQFAALLPDTPLEALARLREGRALTALGRGDAALAAYERAFHVYEENPVIVDYRTIWPFFRLALAISEDQPERRREMGARIFRAAQIIRQSITARTVAGAAALLGQGDGEAARAVRAWQAASERYSNLKALQVLQLRDPLSQADQARALAEEVAAAREEVEALRAARDRIAPEYQSAISAPVSLEELQAQLAPGEAMVQVLAGAPRSFLLIIDREEVTFRPVAVTGDQIAVLVQILRGGLTAKAGAPAPVFPAPLSHQMFRLLFQADKERLLAYDRLVFATTGALQSLPLDVLLTEPPREGWQQLRPQALDWLGDSVSISYVPSPRNLVDIRRGAGDSRAQKMVASWGDFRDGVDPDKVLRVSGLPDTCRRLAEAVDRVGALPGTGAEARAIATMFGDAAKLETGEAFTQEALEAASAEGALADFKVLHFATHGILWPTPDCFTEPALTVTATDGEQSDGLLSSSEIRGLQMDAQLVVLSACNTASGYLVSASASANGAVRSRGISGAGGESLSGLARAFFSAGARAVLATHWPVADEETTALMVDFFRELRDEGLTLSEALQEAQRRMRRDPRSSHPVFWAPFVLIGDASTTL
ncbi:CHAT domain-containing protein [Rhodovulum sp. DZ06]|uniref:CHAT domain-containing protein n=1 Tax=Rhodovulum sp. DZ06 TaxID=3425126 RepID=UPI003D343357